MDATAEKSVELYEAAKESGAEVIQETGDTAPTGEEAPKAGD
jgi:hypothetical protein